MMEQHLVAYRRPMEHASTKLDGRITPVLVAATVLLLGTQVRAGSITYTLNFDSFPDSTHLTTQYSLLGITFSQATVSTAGISLNEFDFPPHSGASVVFDDSSPITLTFSAPTSFVGGYFTYLQPLTIDAFGSGGQLLASATSAFSANDVSSGNPPNEFLSVSALGIADVSITASPTGSSFTLDDLSFTEQVQQVPESATVLLLAIGLTVLVIRKLNVSNPKIRSLQFHDDIAIS
jgi:hypothetical protein